MKKRIKNNKEVSELKNRWEEIINSAVYGIFLKDLSGKYIFINASAANAVGKNIKDFIGKTDFGLFPRSSAEKIIKNDKKVIRTKKIISFEEKIVSSGGDVYFETIKHPILDERGKPVFLCGIVRNVTDWKENEKVLAKKVREISALFKISKDINKIESLDELFNDIAGIACKAINCPDFFIVIWFLDKNKNREIKVFKGVDSLEHAEGYLSKGRSLTFPIKMSGKIEGGVSAGCKNHKLEIVKKEKLFIKEIAELIGKEVERRKIKEDLSRMFIEVVKTLSAALDARDHYTVRHSERISNSCRLIAEKLGLSNKEIENVVMGALLHDIGKIGISDGILGKPGRLTPEEFDKVKKHPLISENILSPIAELKGSLKAIRNHHEHYDGTGYPDGLKGNKIHIGARILAICDAYDAMISERPYRKSMSVEQAVEELKKNSGTQFDPHITEIMIDLIEKNIFR